MAKIKCPYTYPHKSRLDKVDYICNIGGYRRHNDGSWPIEFNVAADNCNFDFDHLWARYAEADDEGWLPSAARENPETLALYYALAKRLHAGHEEHMWEWGQEEAARSLHDADTYRTLWDGTMLNVKLELHGRSGKHLVIASFESHDLEGMDEGELRAQMLYQSDGYHDEITTIGTLRRGYNWYYWSATDVDLLYRYVRQCAIDFTPAKASQEVEYQGAFQFFCNIVNSEWEAELRRLADRETVITAARHVALVVDLSRAAEPHIEEDFATLCRAAGVAPEDLQE